MGTIRLMASHRCLGSLALGGRKASRQAGFMNGHDTESSEGKKKQEGRQQEGRFNRMCSKAERRGRMLPCERRIWTSVELIP